MHTLCSKVLSYSYLSGIYSSCCSLNVTLGGRLRVWGGSFPPLHPQVDETLLPPSLSLYSSTEVEESKVMHEWNDLACLVVILGACRGDQIKCGGDQKYWSESATAVDVDVLYCTIIFLGIKINILRNKIN